MSISVSFHGAVESVTGSCYLLHTSQGNILIDCGMFQGSVFADAENTKPFGFDPREVKAVFITHPHADHTGRLPKLLKEGFDGTIYFTPPCLSLSRLVLEDTFHIMKEEAEREKTTLLFSMEDLAQVFLHAETIGYHHAIEPFSGVTLMFHDAGHVLGSSYISVETEGKRLVFSGDIGNDHVPILPPTEPISSADVIICEATYGDRLHEPIETRREKLAACMERVVKEKGVLLIPSFSIERTQELLYEMDRILLEELKTDVPIFLDSPMSIRATQLYRDYQHYLKFNTPILSEPDRDFFSFPNLRETLTVEASKAINDVPSPKIIIAGSGMMSGGRIMHHLRRHISDAKTTILVIGYQAQGTLGRAIFQGAKEVRMFGEKLSVRAKVVAIGAFSAHGDRDKITRWLQPTDGKLPEKVFLVHGETEEKNALEGHLRRTLQINVYQPKMQEKVEMW